MAEEREYVNLDDLQWRTPYRAQLPTAQQVSAFLAALALVGPAALGGMPVLPVTVYDEQRRRQDQILQESESSVGTYQSSQDAEVGLTLSQKRLALVTKAVEGIYTHDVSEAEVVQAAERVFAGEVEGHLDIRFRSAFNRVVNDTVDLCILRDDEQYEEQLSAQDAW